MKNGYKSLIVYTILIST